jgi:hypothetical protein
MGKWSSGSVRANGCYKADKEIKGVSSCELCPFEDCVAEYEEFRSKRIKVEVDEMGFPILKNININGIRPLLKSNEIKIIVKALKNYARQKRNDSKKCVLLVHRILKKKVFFKGKWFDKYWISTCDGMSLKIDNKDINKELKYEMGKNELRKIRFGKGLKGG